MSRMMKTMHDAAISRGVVVYMLSRGWVLNLE